MSTWSVYHLKHIRMGVVPLEARPYVLDEDLSAVSVSEQQTPAAGGMIARDPENHDDMWYIDATYFAKHFREEDDATHDRD